MSALDTTSEAASVQASVFRAMTPEERLLRAFEMSDLVVQMAEAGLRGRHPDYSDAEVRVAMLRLRLGDELFQDVLPDAPRLAL